MNVVKSSQVSDYYFLYCHIRRHHRTLRVKGRVTLGHTYAITVIRGYYGVYRTLLSRAVCLLQVCPQVALSFVNYSANCTKQLVKKRLSQAGQLLPLTVQMASGILRHAVLGEGEHL